jgi:dihydropteroate synthase
MRAAGLRDEQIVLDVGIGFGKTVPQNLQLLRALAVFHRHGRPLLLGASRKSFIARVAGVDVCGRLPGSLVAACHAVRAGVQVLRVHDVAATREALRVRAAVEDADELNE